MARSERARVDFTLDVAEVQSLRREVVTRTAVASGLVVVEVVGLVLGAALVERAPGVLVGLAVVSSCLWLLWLDHAIHAQKVMAYLEAELAPRLSQVAGRPVLGWESYRYQLDGSGSARTPRSPDGRGIEHTLRPEWHSQVLFGLAPLALGATYAVTSHNGSMWLAGLGA
ncbi:hypothetical protein V5P93_002984 [Actinokineospora auranticolor]|uniref:hypothetical protein n=1 Tax=Actinokineospora auranticolor TaxID=155976 RepID=UPI0011AFE3E0|nr:hypothetical protein [Actinokineospora auranticolor]